MRFLVDTSAWHRTAHLNVIERWKTLLGADSLCICDQVTLEVLYSARNAHEYDRVADKILGMHQVPMTDAAYRRAREVQQRLAHVGGLHHRSVTIADLLIAAAAEAAGVTVLHYDEDFDRIAAITGQATEWIAQRGSL